MMNDPKDFIQGLVAGVIIGCIAVFGVLNMLGESPRAWEDEIIKRGYGELVLEGRYPVFKWKEQPINKIGEGGC